MPGTPSTFRPTLSILILLAGCGGADAHHESIGPGTGTAGSTSGSGAGGASAGTSGRAERGGAGAVGSGGSSAAAGRAGSSTRGSGGTGGRGGSSSAVGGVSAEVGGAGADGGGSGEEAEGGAGAPSDGSGGETSGAGGRAGEGGESGAGSVEGPACPAAWSLGTAVSHQTPDMGKGAFIADLNSDGRADLVALTWLNAVVFLQDATGTLAQSGTYQITDGSYYQPAGAVGDFNGDGAADIIVASVHDVHLFLNDGHGAFGTSEVVSDAPPGASVSANRMRVRDIDGDGALDATLLASPVLITYYGDGHGGITRVGRTRSSPEPLKDFALLDLGGDHHLDAVGLTSALDLLSTVQTDAGFDRDWQTVKANIVNLTATSVEAGDVDGDGLDDIVVSGAGNQPVQLRLLFAREGFGTIQRQPTYDIPQTLAVTDIDGNGTADLLVLHGGWENIGVYNRCKQGLEDERLFPIPFADQYEHDALAVGDLNSDGCPDVAIADYNHGVSVLLAQGCQR